MFTLPLPVLGIQLLVLVQDLDDSVLDIIRELVDVTFPIFASRPLHPCSPLDHLILSAPSIPAVVETYRLIMIPPDTLDGVLDHPLNNFFILVSLGDKVSDMDEDVFRGIV